MKQLFFICSLMLSGLLFGQSEMSFSLQQAIDYGLVHSDSIELAQFEIELAKAQVKETTTIGLPQVSGKVDYNNFGQIPFTLLPAAISDPNAPPGTFIPVQFGRQQSLQAQLTVNQLVFDASYIIGLQASSAFVNLQVEAMELAKRNLKVSISNAYTNVLIAKETVFQLTKNLQNLRHLELETGALFENGFAEEIDVDRLTLAIGDLENQLTTIKNQQVVSEYLFKLLIGYDLNTPIRLTDQLDDLIQNVQVAAQFDVNNMPEYQLIEIQEKLNTLDLRRDQLSYLPNIAAFANFSRQRYADDEFNFFSEAEAAQDEWLPSSVYGVSISMPLFDSGQRIFKAKQKRIELEKTKTQKLQAEKGFYLQYQQARLDLDAKQKNLSRADKNVELAQKIYRVTNTKYIEGIGSSLEVNNALSSLLEAEANQLTATYELVQAYTNFKKATGTL